MISVMPKLSIDVILKTYEDQSVNILFSLSGAVFFYTFFYRKLFLCLSVCQEKKTQEGSEATLGFYWVQV